MYYIESLLADLFALYPIIDRNRVYCMGFSSGGLFTSNIIIKFSNKFAAVCNYMGGYQDDEGCLDLKETKRKEIPIYLITGTEDCMLDSCEKAKKYYEQNGLSNVTYKVLEGKEHDYFPDEIEDDIWSFFVKHKM